MDGKTVRIRSLTASDQKLALWVIGKANLENLATANRQLYTHPLVLLVWTLLSLAFVHFMNWWPSSYRSISGIFRFLIPLPAFASVAVPIMFLIDWKNRPHFESRTQEVIKERDLLQPIDYYNQSPASGFWILEFGENFVGLIALDANDAKDTRRAVIRHFFVHEVYRKTGIQDDLLGHALKHTFNKSPTLESIVAVDTPALVPYIHECLTKAGFKQLTDNQSIGIMGLWKFYTVCLHKKEFNAI
ncbi:hypothetical protein AGABI2DRAFT_197421 [Agaricus bisporus var. bisporus H97]|uniref:hypothetical protein n=1 Tax=Agaricus bisporus var. bisporus (strain H97 / ATCC MYA-4626 / FGSC 10389) TaxID=936046 RepID=UPI00029F60BD|nr:hypothetical protein AGABI2DRAFT_197421 [Agaricus bisporus var. bisporus H97]EKV51400.1 hypothetical protein AGABI2DRAFT_197421 [Agaricus bisporus var. bisporus H97]